MKKLISSIAALLFIGLGGCASIDVQDERTIVTKQFSGMQQMPELLVIFESLPGETTAWVMAGMYEAREVSVPADRIAVSEAEAIFVALAKQLDVRVAEMDEFTELQTNLQEPYRLILKADAKITNAGSHVAYVTGDLRDPQGKIVASFDEEVNSRHYVQVGKEGNMREAFIQAYGNVAKAIVAALN